MFGTGINKLEDIEKHIKDSIEKGKIVFNGSGVFYTDKHNNMYQAPIERMVKIIINAEGWRKPMDKLGIQDQMVKDILMREIAKSGVK